MELGVPAGEECLEADGHGGGVLVYVTPVNQGAACALCIRVVGAEHACLIGE